MLDLLGSLHRLDKMNEVIVSGSVTNEKVVFTCIYAMFLAEL